MQGEKMLWNYFQLQFRQAKTGRLTMEQPDSLACAACSEESDVRQERKEAARFASWSKLCEYPAIFS